MQDIILVINAGSSSLKFQVYETNGVDTLDFAFGGQVSGIGGQQAVFSVKDKNKQLLAEQRLSPEQARNLQAAQEVVGGWMSTVISKEPLAVGHRIVHGGPNFTNSVLIDENVLEQLDALVSLAPLHQRNNLEPVHVIFKNWPQIRQVACFDTAFHRTQPEVADRFALPQFYYKEGIRRYGFHGLSYDYIASKMRQDYPDVIAGKVVVAHLGSGASACAMLNGRSQESTMGFTALDGLPMSTRCGQMDAGVVLWMLEQGMTHDEIQHLLYKESGLKGLSGISADVRELQDNPDPRARLAMNYFSYHIAKGVTGLLTSLQGLDALVFTAGVGENSPVVRKAVCEQLAWLGVEIDPLKNESAGRCISTAGSKVGVYVIPTNEEWVIARQTLALIREPVSSNWTVSS
ncbi:MAG: acetate/propionate family kinase [Alcaligenaceae bacterium]|nr:acetate/propionate family kinase [Alcaligenaceae bacterium]